MNDSRKWALPIIVGALLCSVMLAWVIATVGDIEFHSTKTAEHMKYLPFIAYDFGKIYAYGWILPIATAGIGLLVWNRKIVSTAAIAGWLSALMVAHMFWLLFALFALYLANLTIFIGNIIGK